VRFTFQTVRELARLLAAVESQVQRLHLLLQPPKKRHLARNVVLAGSTFAAGVVVASALHGRRDRARSAAAWNGAGWPEPQKPAAAPTPAGPPAGTDGPPEGSLETA
jgi:hypothetical protein